MLDRLGASFPNLNDAAENRLRPQNEQLVLYGDAYTIKRIAEETGTSEKANKVFGEEECQTCKNRRYQDGSDDPGVSFQSPTRMSPAQATTKVFSHEREHYSREQSKANREDREVISNNIRVFTDVCPECGKIYVSGGETRTVTRKKQEQLPFAKDFFENTVGKYKGNEIDKKI